MSETPTISAVITKSHKDTYKGALTIDNITSITYSNWSITCDLPNPTGANITSLKNFTVSSTQPGQQILTPDPSIDSLPPGTTLIEKIEGNGLVLPTNWSFNTKPSPVKGDVYNIDFTTMTDIKTLVGFTYQYSYPAMNGWTAQQPNPDYFTIETSNGGLGLNVYQTDGPFKSGSSTEPRTELRGLSTVFDDIQYVYQWDEILTQYPPSGDQYCLAQVFGSGPNVMLRFRNGSYELLCTMGGNKNLPLSSAGSPKDDLNQLITWRLEFQLSTSNGYVRCFKNGVLQGEIQGNTSGGGSSYIKLGIYLQEQKPTGTISKTYKNLLLTMP